jgi:hypothetical protein
MSENPDLPQPDPVLRRLDRLVGRWTMEGNLVGSDEKDSCRFGNDLRKEEGDGRRSDSRSPGR